MKQMVQNARQIYTEITSISNDTEITKKQKDITYAKNDSISVLLST